MAIYDFFNENAIYSYSSNEKNMIYASNFCKKLTFIFRVTSLIYDSHNKVITLDIDILYSFGSNDTLPYINGHGNSIVIELKPYIPINRDSKTKLCKITFKQKYSIYGVIITNTDFLYEIFSI